MLRDDIELHNVAAVTEQDDGHRLDRLPADVRRQLNEDAREMYTRPAGAEIRLVSDDETVRVTLSCPEGDGDAQAVPCYGRFQSAPGERVELGPEPTTVELSVPDRLRGLDSEHARAGAFSPAVRRLVLRGQSVHLHDVAGDVRPPRDDEVPDRRFLAYGTSITMGAAASGQHLTYVEQTARRLGADAINLGTSGSAFCEPAIADHVAGREDWDVATLSLSVNMLAAGFAAAEFRERARYVIETTADAHPEKPIACITLFPVLPELSEAGDTDGWATDPETYRDALRDVVAGVPRDNVHLIEGPDLLSDVAGLAPDLVHPTDHGMLEIGERLAPRLEALLEE